MIKERLMLFIEHLGCSVRSFEKKVGAGSFVSSKGRDIVTQKVTKIHKAFPELNTDWLLFGEGKMLKSESLEELIIQRLLSHPSIVEIKEEQAKIRLSISLRSSAQIQEEIEKDKISKKKTS